MGVATVVLKGGLYHVTYLVLQGFALRGVAGGMYVMRSVNPLLFSASLYLCAESLMVHPQI